jgi:hypothetical protein
MTEISQLFQVSSYRRIGRISLWIAQCLMRLLSATVEVYLHRNFGRRYLMTIIVSVVFFVMSMGFVSLAMPMAGLFALGLLLLSFHHCTFAFSRRRLKLPEPHTLSTGDSWELWRRLPFQPTTVQRVFEPTLCVIISFPVATVDPFLGLWLRASGIALFAKEQITRMSMTRRIMDAADARIEAQRLNAGLNHYLQQPHSGTQTSHRARLPNKASRTHRNP